MTQFGQHPRPRFTLAHLSDTHLLAGEARKYGVLDCEARLTRAVARLARLDPTPQALLITGDLTDLGEPVAYEVLREIIEPVAALFGAEVVWTMGNHDDRAAYSHGLFGSASDEPQDRVYDVGGLRVIALDTSVPGYHHGALTANQLRWLREVLATPAEHGTIVAMHHPPIPTPMCEVAGIMELDDQAALADVLTGTDVRAIAAGHLHYPTWSTFAGVPVSVASATCYTTEVAPDRSRFIVSGVDANQSFTMIHVYDDRVVHTLVPIDEPAEITSIPAQMRELAEALSPAELRDLISRKDSPYYTDGHPPM